MIPLIFDSDIFIRLPGSCQIGFEAFDTRSDADSGAQNAHLSLVGAIVSLMSPIENPPAEAGGCWV